MSNLIRPIFDGTGAFLQGELEALDPQIHLPLNLVTWHEDILPRKDVSIGLEHTSWTNSTYGSIGGLSTKGKSWAAKRGNAESSVSLNIQKVTQDLHLWAQTVDWTVIELEQAALLNRPVDVDKVFALNEIFQQDIDVQVYLGDSDLEVFGIANSDQITRNNNAVTNVTNAKNGGWATATPAEIYEDIRELETSVWTQSGYKAAPTKLLVPASLYTYLLQPFTINGVAYASIAEYISRNSVCMARNGIPLDIQPRKWLDVTTPGVAEVLSHNRMVAYTPTYDKVRFPFTPLAHTPIEFEGLYQKTTYYSKLGSVEVVYPSTIGYRDQL